jgi:hypothetical protein
LSPFRAATIREQTRKYLRRDVGIGRRGLLFESRQTRREPTKEPNPSIIVETFPMADINLTQDEADKLMAMEKRAVDKTELLFPAPGDNLAIPLTSLDKRENFMLDVTRAQIKLTKATYQNLARAAIILLRLDLDGPPHRNPTAQKSPARTCTSTAKAMATSGQSRLPLPHTQIRWIFF